VVLIPYGWRFLVNRLLFAIAILWAAFTLSFLILYAVPGDPALLMIGGAETGSIPAEELAKIRAQYGFDQPIAVQYVTHLWNALHGDLGVSYQGGEKIGGLLVRALGSTIPLVVFAMTIALVAGLGIGSAAALTKRRGLARFLDSLPSIGASLPTFWVGLVLMQILSFQLRLLPAAGDGTFASLVMPGLTLAVLATASIAQVASRSMRTAMGEPYVQVALARGASEFSVFVRHVLRNSIMPTLTVFGLVTATLFATSTIVETIFSRRGVGFLLEASVSTKDIPVVQGVVVLIAGIYVLLNLVVDLLYPLVDPRLATRGPGRPRRRPAKSVAP
jgi:peptide/nickel transport system permease protein